MPKQQHDDHDAGRVTLGIDLGGTKILAAVVDAQGQVTGIAKRKTKGERGVDAVIDRIAGAAEKAVASAGLAMDAVVVAGVGVPGVADHHTGVVEFAPNLPDWTNIPLGARLQEMLNVPVFVENDVNAGTYGEAAAGAARD
ncbi:MAG: ROK family protein [Anaerolineae bacterium]|nr:ROK family protein [Anaerolineae bacterium]